MRPFAFLPFALLLGATLPSISGCSFSGAPGSPLADAPPDASPLSPPWWDAAWSHRRRVAVTTGPVVPDKGYAGYTAFLTVDTTPWPRRPDCRDLRLLVWTDATWTELPVHHASCGAMTELRFALPKDLAADTTWRDAYLYYGNPDAAAPAPVTQTNVYLWWDDASANLTAQYQRGRMDDWLGTGYNDTLLWDAAGYYTYACPDDSQGSYRRAVDERDVLIEAETFHTACQLNNMQTGVCVRGIIAAGTGAAESADHYYCSSRGQNPNCNNDDQGIYDGDIVKTQNEALAINNPLDPPAIVANQWRKQALAAFGINPTNLRFWDADASWPRLAAPPEASLITKGTDATDYEGRGFAGLMTSQDSARLRNFVIRRYVEPEPVVAVEDEVSR